MSIDALIHAAVKEKRLFPLLPRAAGEAPHRAMFLSENLWELLNTSWDDPAMETRLGILEADLELFVQGSAIDPKYLFLLYPLREGVWEIRSVREDPSIRVLGLFVRKDVFFAANYALREDLGGWDSREWRQVKRIARTEWTRVFHAYQPMISSKVQDVATGAIDGRYFKG